MAISLYDASEANYLQTLEAVSGFLGRGLSHCRDNDIDPEEIVGTRIFPDMQPFRFRFNRSSSIPLARSRQSEAASSTCRAKGLPTTTRPCKR